MPFPSPALSDFCEHVRVLILAPRQERTAHRDGFCQCEVYRSIEYAPPNQQAQLASGLFWAVWIDQVLYYIAVEGGVPECAADPAVYEHFRNTYPFPKLYSHVGGGHASPYLLLAEWRPYAGPSRNLLLEDKRAFWGEVAEFLDSEGHGHVRRAAEIAFNEDLQLRFPPEHAYLFPTE